MVRLKATKVIFFSMEADIITVLDQRRWGMLRWHLSFVFGSCRVVKEFAVIPVAIITCRTMSAEATLSECKLT